MVNKESSTSDNEGVKKFKCLHIGCSKKYSSMSARSNHMKKCTFPKNNNLKKTKKDVQGKGGYYCRYCKKKYQFRSSVYKHQRLCNPARLLQGQLAIIKKMKQLSCNVCFKKFDRVGKLEAHKKIHTEENVNYCNFCGKRFKRKDFFANHQEKCTTTLENTADGFSDPETQYDDLPTFISFCEGTIYNITDSDADSTSVPDSSSDEVHITHKVPSLSNEVGRNHEQMEEINDAHEVPSVDNAIGGSDAVDDDINEFFEVPTNEERIYEVGEGVNKIHEVPSISNEDGIHEVREKLNDICEAPNPSSDEDSETETDFYSELCAGVFKDLVAHK